MPHYVVKETAPRRPQCAQKGIISCKTSRRKIGLALLAEKVSPLNRNRLTGERARLIAAIKAASASGITKAISFLSSSLRSANSLSYMFCAACARYKEIPLEFPWSDLLMLTCELIQGSREGVQITKQGTQNL